MNMCNFYFSVKRHTGKNFLSLKIMNLVLAVGFSLRTFSIRQSYNHKNVLRQSYNHSTLFVLRRTVNDS